MKKTKLFTSIAALALVLGLGACDTTSEEEVTPDESETTTQSSETTGETTGGEEESKTTPAPEIGEYFLGFDVDGTVNYIDGGTASGYDYEGTLTTNIGYAVPVTLAAADGDDAYYLTFELDEATYYVCIIDTGSHVNLQYLTTATPIYWDETHAAWVNEEDTYFLCYNSSYSCAYASDFDSWWGKSPVGTLLEIPEDWEPYVPTVPEGDTYKLGALDSTNYCYRYFSGEASGNYLATTTDWDKAANVYITAIDDNTENTCTLSFIDSNGDVMYIYHSGSNETNVSIKSEPSTWVWTGEQKGFVDQASDRYLCLYNSDSMRAYAQSNSNAPALPYTTQPEDPEKPELTETFEQVTSLTDGGVYYLGSYSDDTVHFITGATSNYQLATTTDLAQAAVVTVTGSDQDGWKLTLPNGNYIYMFLYNSSNLEFGTSSNSTVPSNGVNVFSWNSSSATLYTTAVAKSNYQYSYFEYYNSLVQAYGASSLSFNNAAHFYQQVTA